MKRLMILICAGIVLMCGFFLVKNVAKEETETDISKQKSEVSTPAANENESKEEFKNYQNARKKKTKNKKVVTVTDETGKKRSLKMENADAEDCGEFLRGSAPTATYSQVLDDHYYYMRSDGNGNYVIYRDKGKEIGRFSVGKGEFIEFFSKYGKDYFALLYEFDKGIESIESDDGYTTKLIQIDLEKGGYTILPNAVWDWNEIEDGQSATKMYLTFYQKYYFFDLGKMEPSHSPSEEDYYYISDKLTATDKLGNQTEIVSTSAMNVAKPCLSYVDGKIYYGSMKKKKVTLYAYDLASGKEEKILCYKRTKPCDIQPYGYIDTTSKVEIFMDQDYIYCQDYIIPRRGGKMIRLFQDALLFNWAGTISFSSNSRYIYYIDKNYRVKRFNKRTKQVKVISAVKAMEVQCTEKGIYVKKYKECLMPGYWDDGDTDFEKTDDPTSCDVYYMDLDGKHARKIAD